MEITISLVSDLVKSVRSQCRDKNSPIFLWQVFVEFY